MESVGNSFNFQLFDHTYYNLLYGGNVFFKFKTNLILESLHETPTRRTSLDFLYTLDKNFFFEIGFFDDSIQRVLDFGSGYRWFSRIFMIGGNLFVDYDYVQELTQTSLGVEIATRAHRINTNLYIPIDQVTVSGLNKAPVGLDTKLEGFIPYTKKGLSYNLKYFARGPAKNSYHDANSGVSAGLKIRAIPLLQLEYLVTKMKLNNFNSLELTMHFNMEEPVKKQMRILRETSIINEMQRRPVERGSDISLSIPQFVIRGIYTKYQAHYERDESKSYNFVTMVTHDVKEMKRSAHQHTDKCAFNFCHHGIDKTIRGCLDSECTQLYRCLDINFATVSLVEHAAVMSKCDDATNTYRYNRKERRYNIVTTRDPHIEGGHFSREYRQLYLGDPYYEILEFLIKGSPDDPKRDRFYEIKMCPGTEQK